MESQRLEPSEWLLRDLSGKTQWPKLPTDQALCLIMLAPEKLVIVLVWISNAMRKHSIQKQLGRRGFISSHPSSSQSIMGGSRSRKPKEEPKPETMERFWLLACSLALSLARAQLTCFYSPGPPAQWALTTVGRTTLYQVAIEEMYHRNVHKSVWRRHLFNWVSPSQVTPDWSDWP